MDVSTCAAKCCKHDNLEGVVRSVGLTGHSLHGVCRSYDLGSLSDDQGAAGRGHITNYAQNIDGTVWNLTKLKQHLGMMAGCIPTGVNQLGSTGQCGSCHECVVSWQPVASQLQEVCSRKRGMLAGGSTAQPIRLCKLSIMWFDRWPGVL